ncbi:ABC transporter ATP-binding protein [Maribacter sp. 2307UL18-2]|uniref:ABC transporter ATP-binding protein n=1 Tax=Maribacter sp. 2307UL18-2 TaxID=3386274 RepID=UPI0039BD5BC7
MIQIQNLEKSFRTKDMETIALNNVNLKVESGEFVVIMRPSGCGKSTLLNIIGLLDNFTEGSYQFAGNEVANLKEGQRTELRKGNMGFVFQSFNLIEDITVFENVELPLIYLKENKVSRKKKVMKILRHLKIDDRTKHFPNQLSGGQQQRVAIARALVTNPKLILADEPTGNLDSKNGREVMALLTQMSQEGTTIIMVTHSVLNSQYGHRVVNLFDGQIVAQRRNKAMDSR